ncbi:MAG: hypothetical protein CVU39_03980 [Chloroflexi bacterium HGW-Chloroflexi-10]|nr:MAG: hypothetical protein CVU39_03980 [Chloroflexi bacterium HGW-Chloroflexi-10]
MWKKIRNLFLRLMMWVVMISISVPLLTWIIAKISYQQRIYTTETVSSGTIAIVFGAGLQRDGTPTRILKDRVETAVSLFQTGKAQKILLSGDNRFINYNEPGSMRAYALQLGVPPEALILDYAGRRTYDTCYRAKNIFKVNQAILVTQNFHLTRAMFLCDQLGIDVTGVKSDQGYYLKRSRLYWNIREIFATFNAVWDVWVLKPIPVLGDELPIL